MPSSLVELRPDRRLLDPEFEGYKLNLQELPHYSHELVAPVDRVYPDEVQYSFIHAKLFALHNHLVLDQWDYNFNYYYIDDKQQVRRVTFESSTHVFKSTVVYDVPAHVDRKPGHFNLCLSFPTSALAVLSDGTGYLHIIDSGLRRKLMSSNQLWQTVHSSLVLGEDKYFIILDTRVEEKDNGQVLHCLLQSVEQIESTFYSILTWVTFKKEADSWKQISMRQLQGKGIVHYAAIEPSCTALYVASDNPFKFTMDTVNEILETPPEQPKTIIYTWLQTEEDITVTLKLEPDFDKDLLHIMVSPYTIKVSYVGKVFVEGRLRHKIDSVLTTWNVQDDGQVDILITKDVNILWDDFLLEGDCNGEQILDASLVEEAHRRLAHLCSETEVLTDHSVAGVSTQELEECDAASEEDTLLVRLDTSNHAVTHRIPLSVHQFIFSVKLETHEVPALVLRQEVDACVWQPYSQLINSNTWPVKHQGTLMAFGYVQSSKQNRKFLTCPPNFSYSVVCEASKHILIYQNSPALHNQLRRRSCGVMKNIKLGVQHVFNIDKYGEVVGINAANEFLFVLMENSLLVIEIL